MTTDTHDSCYEQDHDDHDLDVPGLASTVRTAEHRLRDHFKATEASITQEGDAVTLRLEFRGFNDFSAADERVSEVAAELNDLQVTESVHTGVNTDGAYDPQTEEHDDRPMGWVNATLEFITIRLIPDHEAEDRASDGRSVQIPADVTTVGDLRDALDIGQANQVMRVLDPIDPDAVGSLGDEDDPVVIDDGDAFTIVERPQEVAG